MFEQARVVEVDRRRHRFVQPPLALAFLGDRGIAVAQRDAGARREPFDRFREVEVLDVTDERDGIAALLATETMPYAKFLVDGERGCLLLVERTQALEAAADTLQ